ncbi:uncharacterized protein OCT59_006614 [Rhizophagus irregularis]|uniref:uncharacterized protein n=1 Tax=Rhizophagus irregularis TaxID=588596 RepID=UPI003334A1FA|nr:hypothetical protein OCT59_006614 [Rhizophagus irregularis]
MKYRTSEHYRYLVEPLRRLPRLQWNPPPMTTSKQDHIISTLPPLFQFIKDTYLIKVELVVEKPAEKNPLPVGRRPTEETKKTPPPVIAHCSLHEVKPAPVINEDPIPEESPAPIESDTMNL